MDLIDTKPIAIPDIRWLLCPSHVPSSSLTNPATLMNSVPSNLSAPGSSVCEIRQSSRSRPIQHIMSQHALQFRNMIEVYYRCLDDREHRLDMIAFGAVCPRSAFSCGVGKGPGEVGYAQRNIEAWTSDADVPD
jgi:hypothetical protein